MKILYESLDYMDLEGIVDSKISVDEYSAKMGKDKDIVSLTFVVHSKLAADDLVTWFERGYDWVMDASTSEGELEPGKWLVFVELTRRSTVPHRIITLLKDLGTLTGLKLKDWTVDIGDEEYDADEDTLRQVMILNPAEYKMDKEAEEKLNEYRNIAGLDSVRLYKDDIAIKNMKAIAGL